LSGKGSKRYEYQRNDQAGSQSLGNSPEVNAAILAADEAFVQTMFPEAFRDTLDAEFILDDILDAEEIG
jgi:hypothetical protein